MNKKLICGIIVLVVLIGIVGVYLIRKEFAEIKKIENETAEVNKLIENRKKQQNVNETSNGNKPLIHTNRIQSLTNQEKPAGKDRNSGGIVRHGNHEESQNITITIPENPVEGLRELLRQQAHWSAEWIPPFPPTDSEAQTIASNVYIYLRYRQIGKDNHPKAQVALKSINKVMDKHQKSLFPNGEPIDDLNDVPFVRQCDLEKLFWPFIDSESAVDPGGWPTTFE